MECISNFLGLCVCGVMLQPQHSFKFLRAGRIVSLKDGKVCGVHKQLLASCIYLFYVSLLRAEVHKHTQHVGESLFVGALPVAVYVLTSMCTRRFLIYFHHSTCTHFQPRHVPYALAPRTVHTRPPLGATTGGMVQGPTPAVSTHFHPFCFCRRTGAMGSSSQSCEGAAGLPMGMGTCLMDTLQTRFSSAMQQACKPESRCLLS